MLMTILKYAYALNALLLALSIIYGKIFVFNKKDANFISDYCAGIAIFFVLYVILSFAYVGLLPSVYSKTLMLGFAFSPFILGLLATYHTEKYYTVLQLFLIATSVVFVF